MTSDERKRRFGPQGGDSVPGSDSDLAILDPGLDDLGYWSRFRSLVMARADHELSRRRLAVEVGVLDFLQSWSRTVIRAAVLAAAIAGVLFIRGRSVPEWDIEQALTVDLEDRTLPQSMDWSEGDDPFLLAEATF
jgi:hypothetical protein